ncbi:MAG: hypothetical protein JWN21_2113 [Sphingomonas bacterium]|nr:hypothetical protein [Sphingomonas bacterium]
MKTPFTEAFQPIFKRGKYLPSSTTHDGAIAPKGF